MIFRSPQSGRWWARGVDNQVPGTLSMSDEMGPQLELEGDLSQGSHRQTGWPTRHDHEVVYGQIGGREITLVDCKELRVFPLSSHLTPRAIVDGVWLDSRGTEFKRIRAQFTHLAAWAVEPDGSLSVSEDQKEASLRLRVGPDQSWSVDGIEIVLKQWVTWQISRPVLGPLSRDCCLELTAQDGLSIDEWWGKYLFPLRVLLSLLTGHHNLVTSWQLERPSRPDKPNQWADIYIPQTGRVSAEPSKFLHDHDMIISKTALAKEGPSRHLAKWFEHRDSLSTVWNLYLDLKTKQLPLDHRFTTIVQALEALHRASPPTELYTHELSGSKEPALKSRLAHLMKEYGLPCDIRADQVESFATEIKNTRNYLTHYNPKLRDKALTGVDLLHATWTLEWLFTSALLHILGLDTATIQQGIQSNHEFSAQRANLRRDL